MKKFLYLLFTFSTILNSTALHSQSTKPTISTEPAWVTKNTIDYNNTSLDKEASDGYIDISFEKQVCLAEQSEYLRFSKKIISQAGVQNGSEISVSFDPSYEKLIFHTIRIIRNGESLERLSLSKIKILHQESELTDFIYNGLLDAVLILEDVRRGDIIEYSYTVKGFNPIFKNKYAASYRLEYSFPFYQVYYKLIVPKERKLNIKNLNRTADPKISSVNGQQVYEWRNNNIPPLKLQDYTPSWYDPYAQVLVSEFNTWKEVNDWAMELFPVKKDLSAALKKNIKQIELTNASDEERTKAALIFVQDDIRYMGFEMGENSHKPADPSKVFAQRFGDCKEKSYLLCCMLRAMNIEANPVLINTVDKKNIGNLLPAANDFDHVTVRVKLGNSYYWFDPTIAYQRGDIKNFFYPDYQAGLVIADSTVDITPIEFRSMSYQHVREVFNVKKMVGKGTLTVTTQFQGAQADNQRSDFNSESISEIMTSFQKFYATYYEDIMADSLTYTDNDSTGIFTTIEYYTIPKFWDSGRADRNSFSFSSFIINNVVRNPKEKDRKMPFRLLYPAKYEEEVVIQLPQNWKVTDGEIHLKNSSYEYNCLFYYAYNTVHLVADYESFKDYVAPEEAPEYFNDYKKYEDYTSFEISLGKGEDDLANAQSNRSNKNILLSGFLISSLIGGLVWWSQRK